ncbi:MAG: pseudouridine synthase [Thermodesulfobacteriota bacterium]
MPPKPVRSSRPGPARKAGPKPPSPAPAAPQAVRINKALAQAGVCSRRAADELVAAGRVLVNGVPAQPGQAVDPARDRVEVDGRPVDLVPAGTASFVLMLHKPVRTVTTARDPEGRPTVFDLLPEKYRSRRLVHVGRLDFFSEGLLLLTDDGELCNRLTHPRRHLPRVYEVTVRGPVPEKALAAMRAGMTLAEGERLAPAQADILETGPGRSVLRLVLGQGLNRQIRRMCRDLDLTVLKLVRVALGPLELGALRPGEARPLTDRELDALRRSVGL